MTVLLMLRSAAKESLRPQRQGYFGAQSHTPRNSCVRFAAGVTAGLAQHSPPGGSLRPTWAGLSPADCASLLAHLCPPYKSRQSNAQILAQHHVVAFELGRAAGEADFALVHDVMAVGH